MTDFSDLDTPAMSPVGEEYIAPPAWPKVVGIISIVWAALGLTCSGCGVVGLVMNSSMGPQMEQAFRDQGETAPLPPSMQVTTGQYAQVVVGVLMALLLLFAGITTLARSSTGRMLHLAYGALSLPLAAWSVYITMQQMAAMDQYVQDYPDSMFAAQHNPAIYIGMLAFGLVLGLAWPVFCLVWFGVIKTKPEQMTGSETSVA